MAAADGKPFELIITDTRGTEFHVLYTPSIVHHSAAVQVAAA